MNHILVVDDEPLMRTWLSKSIPKHSTCFDVPNTAQDGIEAIEYLKQAAYDVVITDIKMPGMDGLSLAKFIQENYPDTVVIIISGFNDFAYARKAIQYGVKDYLLKPLVDDDLIKLLNDISKRLQKHTPTLLANPTEEERANPRAMLFRAILEDDSNGIYQGYKVFSSTDTDPMLPYACVIQAALLPIARDNAVLPTEAHSRNYRQNLAAVSLCKKYNWTPFFGNNGDTYIVAEGETKAALIANLHYCNVNSSYLSNLFHKQLGISYSKYLMQIRMERAAAYLKDSPETKIYEIGEKLGFVSTKHFISVFKKYYGVSPTTYQKEQRES